MWNPFKAHADSVKRREVKKNILLLLKAKVREPNDCLGLSGMKFTDQNISPSEAEKIGFLSLVIEELCRENPQYSVIHWRGEPAIVLTGGVDAIRVQDKSIIDINEAAGFIDRGGKF